MRCLSFRQRAEEIVEEPEVQIHSFVLKLWLEEVDEETGQPVWRGHITHVAGGERRYVNMLDEIAGIIALYLVTTRIDNDDRAVG